MILSAATNSNSQSNGRQSRSEQEELINRVADLESRLAALSAGQAAGLPTMKLAGTRPSAMKYAKY